MSAVTLDYRAALYANAFPNYPRMTVDKGWLMGIWCIGALYKRTDPTIYGGYPGNYLKRVLSMFPEVSPKKTLHIFAGHTPLWAGGVRVDIDATRHPQPTILGDARRLPFVDGAFELVIADPPYSATDAKKYGHPMISRRHVMHELRRITSNGGLLCWLDTVRPMYRRQDWTQVGAIGVLVSTNTRTRLLSIFQAGAAAGCERGDLACASSQGALDLFQAGA